MISFQDYLLSWHIEKRGEGKRTLLFWCPLTSRWKQTIMTRGVCASFSGTSSTLEGSIPEAILPQVTGRELESSPVAGIAITQVSLWDLCVSFWYIEMFGAYPSIKEISFICLFFHSFISSGNIYYESSNTKRCSGCWEYKSGDVFVPAFPALKI